MNNSPLPSYQILPTENGLQRLDADTDARMNLRWATMADAFKASLGEISVWSSILGIAMQYPQHCPQIFTTFKATDFPRTIDQLLFDKLEDHWRKFETIAVYSALPETMWEIAADYMDAVVSDAGLEASIKLAIEYRERRTLATGLGKALEALAEGGTVAEVQGSALTALTTTGEAKKGTSFSEIRDMVITRQEVPRLPTGILALDQLLYIRNGNFGVIAARPGVGKSTFIRQLAMAQQSFGHILINSLEMEPDEVVQAMLGTLLGRDSRLINGPALGEHGQAKAKNIDLDISIHKCTKVSQLEVAIRAAMARGPVAAVYVDYLQLMESEKGGENRNVEITRISRDLKILAAKLNLPIIALSQLSRASSTEEPELHHLRDSGAIEQDANFVLFIHAPENGFPGQVELLLKKQRAGGIGTVSVTFEKSIGQFY